MTNSNGSDRLDRIAAAIERTQRQIDEGFQRTQQQIEGLCQRMTTATAAKEYPINRLATAEEMARVVMWLSSDDATIMVGTDIDATGGYLTK